MNLVFFLDVKEIELVCVNSFMLFFNRNSFFLVKKIMFFRVGGFEIVGI